MKFAPSAGERTRRFLAEFGLLTFFVCAPCAAFFLLEITESTAAAKSARAAKTGVKIVKAKKVSFACYLAFS